MTAHAHKPTAAHAAAAVEPRSGTTIVPTPTQHEIDSFLLAQASATLRGTASVPTWHLAMDGSAIDMSSPDPTAKTTSFP